MAIFLAVFLLPCASEISQNDLRVVNTIWIGFVGSNHNEDMLEVRPHGLRSEREGPGLLKDDGDYVIADVPFPR